MSNEHLGSSLAMENIMLENMFDCFKINDMLTYENELYYTDDL